jgi:hypothetical protein
VFAFHRYFKPWEVVDGWEMHTEFASPAVYLVEMPRCSRLVLGMPRMRTTTEVGCEIAWCGMFTMISTIVTKELVFAPIVRV